MTNDNQLTPTPKPTLSNYKIVENWKILFGKHKGAHYGEIPDGYLRWCYDNGIIKNEKVNEYIEERLDL
jgi:uncharacterized protein (DUF3820 family)